MKLLIIDDNPEFRIFDAANIIQAIGAVRNGLEQNGGNGFLNAGSDVF
ncbi:MAG TPA: hypothetical protein VJU54_05130 [Nitrospiraceae bacterium]|nr:hypothetical protein [Nitrospiraceae bacterium]